MDKCFRIVLFFVFLPAVQLLAQDKQNFSVGPQNTNCDSINYKNSVEQIIKEVENTKFRFQQQFTVNRIKGFQGAYYYSCNNQVGYLIVKEDDKKKIYNDIPISEWKNMLTGNNPINYYYQKIVPKYTILH